MSLSPLTYQPHSNFQLGGAMFTTSSVQLRLELLVCDRSVSVNVITHTLVGLKCLTETKIQILCDHVDHRRFHIVETGCQMVQLLSAHIVRTNNIRQFDPSLSFICLLISCLNTGFRIADKECHGNHLLISKEQHWRSPA